MRNTKPIPEIPVGQRFGMLVVDGPGYRERLPNKTWIYYPCLCDCGVRRGIRRQYLIKDGQKSCGCYQNEWHRKPPAPQKQKHPKKSDHPLYLTWRRMIGRCTTPSSSKYKHYGARGVRVCERWLASFDAFCADMGPKPTSLHSIDRIDTNGHYEPTNCRWATDRQQRMNRRCTVRVSLDGETYTLNEWADITGLPEKRIRRRLEAGWPPERALREPRQDISKARMSQLTLPAASSPVK
jgi:hypothetical protein